MLFPGRVLKLLISLCLAVGGLAAVPGTACAHPHVFADANVEIVFDSRGLAGFRVVWVFDEMFSNMIIFDHDRNKNRSFEPREIESVKKGAFSNLRKFGYFAHVRINGKPFDVEYVKDFSASIEKGAMTYSFFIPCHVRAANSDKKVCFSMYDDSYYTDITLVGENPVRLKNADDFQAAVQIRRDRENAFYYGQVYPEEIVLEFKRDG